MGLLTIPCGIVATEETITSEDYANLRSRQVGTYSSSELAGIDQFISDLQANSIWATIDAFYFMATIQREDAKLNWKSNNYNLVEQAWPNWLARAGFMANNGGGRVNTDYIPSTAGGNFTLNSGTLAFYTITTASGNHADMGTRNGDTSGSTQIISRWSDGQAYGGVNGSNANIAVSNSKGLTSASRILSIPNSTQLFKNGMLVNSIANAPNTLSNWPMFIMSRNQGGTPIATSNRTASAACIASGWTDVQSLQFYDALIALLTAFGVAT